MAKLKHQKRSKPRPMPVRRRQRDLKRAADTRTRRLLDDWRRSGGSPS